MSEYQYYEFLAIDRPLSDDDRRAMRAISTRAEITSTSFTNHYEWGNFKGDPVEFMRRWFDIHVYVANWGSPRLMIRLPRRFVDPEKLVAMLWDSEYSGVIDAGEHVILDLAREEVESDRYFIDGSEWMDQLKPLRDDVLAGDLRLLYLIWLIGVEDGIYEDEDEEEDRRDTVSEPISGIGPLTPQLKAAAEFFFLDEDLVAAAAERTSGSSSGVTANSERVREVISGLPDKAKTDLLVRLHEGDPYVGYELRTDVRARTPLPPVATGQQGFRTVRELLSRAESIRERRGR
jgi:hypothetical protein